MLIVWDALSKLTELFYLYDILCKFKHCGVHWLCDVIMPCLSCKELILVFDL